MKKAQNQFAKKAIGRRLQHSRQKLQRRLAPTRVGVLMAVVAGLAFLTGLKVDEFRPSFNGVFSDSNSELPADLDYSSVEEVYDLLKKEFDGQLKSADLVNGLKKGLAEATGDAYTTYLNSTEADEFSSELSGTFEGIGMVVDKKGELVVVISPLKGYPAEKAGIKKGDKVLKIDKTDVVGMSIEEAVRLIRGDEGTTVKLVILRGDKQLKFSVVREKIVVPSVEYELLTGGIGLITLSRFAEDSEKLSLEAIDSWDDDELKGVILDLRGNSGGLITSAQAIAGLWLKNKVVVEQRAGTKGEVLVDSLKTDGIAPLAGVPTVVLIDEGSASASEIVAGALQDYGVAQVLGTTSYGKGSVQALDDLNDGGVLKVTVAKWYTPKGKNIDGTGIKPDIEVRFKSGTPDNQLEAARKLLKT